MISLSNIASRLQRRFLPPRTSVRLRKSQANYQTAQVESLEDRTLLAAFVVNTINDMVDVNPGDGVAIDANGFTSLRAAIMEANVNNETDTIQLPAGVYELSLLGTGEDSATTGDLDVVFDVNDPTAAGITIIGDAASTTTITASNTLPDRVFDVQMLASLELQNVLVSGGQEINGGGIRNRGTLDVIQSVVTNNTASDFGGGIYNDGGFLFVNDSRITLNDAGVGGGGLFTSTDVSNQQLGVLIDRSTVDSNLSEQHGGGIHHDGGVLTLVNATVSSNTALNGAGGGIAVDPFLAGIGSITELISSTVTGNEAIGVPSPTEGFGGGIFAGLTSTPSANNIFEVSNSIVAENIASEVTTTDVSGGFLSLGYNLVGTVEASGAESIDSAGSSNGPAFEATGDQTGSIATPLSPAIGLLRLNQNPSGTTLPHLLTHALIPGSPAIDAGDPNLAPTGIQLQNDGRLAPRVAGVAIDIGAFETVAAGSIQGGKWQDLNGDGNRDPGEVGLNGWTIDLLDSLGQVVATQVTANVDLDLDGNIDPDTESGIYVFQNVADGSYVVQEEFRTDWQQTFPEDGLVLVAFDLDQQLQLSSSGDLFVNWGGVGEKWFTGSGGWYFILPDGSLFEWDGVSRTPPTGALVANLSPQYHADPTLLFNAQVPLEHTIVVTAGTAFTDIDFGNIRIDQPGSIDGLIFNDSVIVNGMNDAGEPPIPGWTVELLDLDGSVVMQTTAFGDGTYSFAGVLPGSYTVHPVVESGWSNGADTTDPLNRLAFQLDQQLGFFTDGSFFENVHGRGEKWFRATNNSNRWYFITPTGSVVEWDRVTSGGGTQVAQLAPRFHDDPLLLIEPSELGSIQIAVQPGQAVSPIDFGFVRAGSIHGRSFEDVDGSSVHETGEPWLDGWTVELLNTAGSVIRTTTTMSMDLNSDGAIDPETETGLYWFEDVAPGEYLVSQVLPADWDQTAPPIDPLVQQAFDLDQSLGLFSTGNLFENVHGQAEKWFRAANRDNRWHFITPSGAIFQWDQVPGSGEGALVTTLTPAFHLDVVAALLNAPRPGSIEVVVTGDQDTTVTDFGSLRSTSIEIHGFQYIDTDGNGLYDPNVDRPAVGVRTELWLNSTPPVLIDAGLTNEDGEFWFVGNIPPGELMIDAITPAINIATTPFWVDVTVDSGQQLVAFAGQSMGASANEIVLGATLMFGHLPRPEGGAFLNDDILIVYGTSGNDQISITESSTRVDVVLNGVRTRYVRSVINRIVVQGFSGSDTIGSTASAPTLTARSGTLSLTNFASLDDFFSGLDDALAYELSRLVA